MAVENYDPNINQNGYTSAKDFTLTGSAGFDMSGSTGTFKTPTGVSTFGGSIIMATGKSLTLSNGGLIHGSGGATPITAPSGIANWQPIAATSGTDTTPANGTQFVTSIFIPHNKTITNINYLIGSVGGTDKVYGALYDSAGAVLASTSVSGGGATVGTAANIQTLALSATYAAKGPGLFYVGISMNGNTARLRSIPAFCQAGTWGNSVSQTHGTVAAITPMTAFTADKAPVVFLD
jgi:hypothetical protein